MKFTRQYVIVKTGEEVEVELDVNVEEIARTLAARAVRNRNRTATAMGGDLRVTVRKGLAGLPKVEEPS